MYGRFHWLEFKAKAIKLIRTQFILIDSLTMAVYGWQYYGFIDVVGMVMNFYHEGFTSFI